MKALKYTILLSALLIGTLQVDAQKFGYINSSLLLEEMPKIKEANSNLETLQKTTCCKRPKESRRLSK